MGWESIFGAAATGFGAGFSGGMRDEVLRDEAYEEEKAIMNLKQQHNIEDNIWKQRMADVQWGRELQLADKKMQHEKGLLADEREAEMDNRQWAVENEQGNRQWQTEFAQKAQDNQMGTIGVMAKDLKNLNFSDEEIKNIITATNTRGRHGSKKDIGDITKLQESVDAAYEDYKSGDEFQTQESWKPFGIGDEPGAKPMEKEQFTQQNYPWTHPILYPQGGEPAAGGGAGGGAELPDELSTVLYSALDNAMKSEDPRGSLKGIIDTLPDKMKPFAMNYLEENKGNIGGVKKNLDKQDEGPGLVEGLLSGEIDTSVNIGNAPGEHGVNVGYVIGKAGGAAGEAMVNLPKNVNKLGNKLLDMYGDAWDLSTMTGNGMIDLVKWAYTDLDKQGEAYGVE